jgi:bifunctional non-homologous end joining protein LigD
MTIKPMLARPHSSDVIVDSDWDGYFLEPKHDGMRCIVERTKTGLEIYSRTGKSQVGKCPELEASLMTMPVGTVFDGELVFIDRWETVANQQVPVVDFNKTMRIMGSGMEKARLRQQEYGQSIEFILFDVPVEDVTQDIRTDLLSLLDLKLVHKNPVFSSNFSEIHQELMDIGIEGSILKDKAAFYEQGGRPRNTWYKFKKVSTYDVVVMGAYEGEGKHVGRLGGLIYGAFSNDELVEIGRVGGGFSDEQREEFWKSKPFGATIEVKANELVGSGEVRTPRHPQFVCVRIDKQPSECLIDQFKEGF